MSQQPKSTRCPCPWSKTSDKGDGPYEPLLKGNKPEDEHKKPEKGKQKKDDNENNKNKDDKKGKKEFHKKIVMDTINIPDIDDTFREFARAINPFIDSREKIQTARQSFEKIVHTLCRFNPEKEMKVYMDQLKKKAKQDGIIIYIDVTNGIFVIKVSSSGSINPPKPYQDAVKALTAIKNAVDQLVDLEPQVQHGVTQTITDVAQINPETDLRQYLTSKRDLLKLPGMISKFKKNLQKVKETPAIISEYVTYVKQLLSDIMEAINEDIPTPE